MQLFYTDAEMDLFHTYVSRARFHLRADRDQWETLVIKADLRPYIQSSFTIL